MSSSGVEKKRPALDGEAPQPEAAIRLSSYSSSDRAAERCLGVFPRFGASAIEDLLANLVASRRDVVDPFGVGRPHPRASRPRLVGEYQVVKNGLDFPVVRPGRFVDDAALLIDDIDHIRQASPPAMDRPLQVVDQDRIPDAVLVEALPGILELLLPTSVVAVALARMRLSDVDSQTNDALVRIALQELVQGRDLAHKGGSGDAPELQHDVLLSSEL